MIPAIRAAAATKPPATVAMHPEAAVAQCGDQQDQRGPAIVTWTSPVSTCPAAVAGPDRR